MQKGNNYSQKFLCESQRLSPEVFSHNYSSNYDTSKVIVAESTKRIALKKKEQNENYEEFLESMEQPSLENILKEESNLNEIVVSLNEVKENNNLLVDFNFDEGRALELINLGEKDEFILINEGLEVIFQK